MEQRKEWEDLLDRAHAAAREAATKYIGTIGGKDAFPAGFAWVTIDGMTPLARYCRGILADARTSGLSGADLVRVQQRYGEAWRPGWGWWASQWTNVQNVDAKRAACNAFQEVLAKERIRATTGSRWD